MESINYLAEVEKMLKRRGFIWAVAESDELPRGQRKYKDTVFCMLFRKKTALLSLYNAVNKTHFSNVDDLEVATLENAINKAVEDCIREGILADFLREQKAEVVAMSIFEYDQEGHMEVIREEGWEDGHRQGLRQGLSQGLIQGRMELGMEVFEKLIEKGFSREEALAITRLSEDQV